MAGVFDVILIESFVAQHLLRNQDVGNVLQQHDLKIESGDIHFMLSKQSVKAPIFKRFEAAVSKLKLSQSLKKIVNRYL